MTKRKSEIIDADFTVVEEPKEAPKSSFNIEDVGEMVMVGRYKSGEEFVIPVNFDDALKAKAYCQYGEAYFNFMIERAVYNQIKAKESAVAKGE